MEAPEEAGSTPGIMAGSLIPCVLRVWEGPNARGSTGLCHEVAVVEVAPVTDSVLVICRALSAAALVLALTLTAG